MTARSAKYNLGGGNGNLLPGTDSEFKALHRIKATEGKFNPAREGTFHYVIWGDYYDNGTSSGSLTSVVVTSWSPSARFWGQGKQRHPRGSVLHELGHNLALSHGGWDEINYKPNYYSVMNYQYTSPACPWLTVAATSATPPPSTACSTRRSCTRRAALVPTRLASLYKGKPANQSIDFNRNGKIDTEPVSVDLNGDGMITNLGAQTI